MLNEPTLEKLQSLRFDGMAAAWSEQQQKHGDLASLSFDERFGLLVDAEWLHRQNKRTEVHTMSAERATVHPASPPGQTRRSSTWSEGQRGQLYSTS
jgi:hypothetical protein